MSGPETDLRGARRRSGRAGGAAGELRAGGASSVHQKDLGERIDQDLPNRCLEGA